MCHHLRIGTITLCHYSVNNVINLDKELQRTMTPSEDNDPRGTHIPLPYP